MLPIGELKQELTTVIMKDPHFVVPALDHLFLPHKSYTLTASYPKNSPEFNPSSQLVSVQNPFLLSHFAHMEKGKGKEYLPVKVIQRQYPDRCDFDASLEWEIIFK
jgi:hypothetical protein